MGTTNFDAVAAPDGFTGPTSGAVTASSLTLGASVVTAAGSNSQANSTAITAPLTVVTTVSATTRGVRLPAAVAGLTHIVANAAGTNNKVYPATGDRIGTAATNAAVTLTKNKSAIYAARDETTWQVIAGA